MDGMEEQSENQAEGRERSPDAEIARKSESKSFHRGGAEKSNAFFSRMRLHEDCADPEEQRSRFLGPHLGHSQISDGNAGSDPRNSMSLCWQDESEATVPMDDRVRENLQ